MRKYFSLLVGAIMLVSCQKEIVENSFEGQAVLFSKEYINYAWGYQHFGWIMDSDGVIRSYNQPEKWNFIDSVGYISSGKMVDNINITTSILLQVDKDETSKFYPKAMQSLYGKTTVPTHEMSDFGTITYSAYVLIPETGKFKRIVLYQYGDVCFINTSEAAREIYTWMKNLESRIDLQHPVLF